MDTGLLDNKGRGDTFTISGDSMNDRAITWIEDKSCPICGEGRLIVVRSLVTQRLLILCDDCESCWIDPHELSSRTSMTLKTDEKLVAVHPDEMRNHPRAALLVIHPSNL
jgi:hypothetical protein